MQTQINQWDYLIITASNDAQAQAYESQLKIRQDLGLLSDVREAMVVADPDGKRIGSGGSTLYCLMEVLNHQQGVCADRNAWEEALSKLRILIIHAGGDSKRLPAYGPCGKIFVPVPGESDRAVCLSLFDRQLPIYLALPEPTGCAGQVAFTSGDVLLRFEPSDVRFAADGVTGLSCFAEPQQASRHGVFCRGQADEVRLYLQKPSPDEQREKGALDAYGQACLDIGVMSFGAKTAVKMLEIFGASLGPNNKLTLTGQMGESVHKWGLDFYREICCAMGSQARREFYLKSVKNSGSKWNEILLNKLFDALSDMPFSMQLLKQCDFLDFGSSRAIINSGIRLLQEDRGISHLSTFLDVNNNIANNGIVQGSACWVEGCRISSSLNLGGENVVVGVDVDEPISLPLGSCLDVIKGRNNQGEPVWFVRCYDVDDTFKETIRDGCYFCGMEIFEWLKAVSARPEDVWDAKVPKNSRSVWNARVFPSAKNHSEYQHWLWMLDVTGANDEQLASWRTADRYSLEQILVMADHNEFYNRRRKTRAQIIRQSLRRMFRPDSELSSAELAYLLKSTEDLSSWISQILKEAYWHFSDNNGGGTKALVFPRIIHTLGSALFELYKDNDVPLSKALPNLEQLLTPAEQDWLATLSLSSDSQISIVQWSKQAQNIAFEHLEKVIIASGLKQDTCPRSTLRSDEIVWARAPARLDVGGGWTDTPPYSLEYGGCVVNAAVDLNGQPPIQVYVRVINEPVIRISSIDLGTRIEITDFDGLLDYREATSSFALAKAALVLSGLSPQTFHNASLKKALQEFGGGIELTTLAAIPKGSGLGTSSIMGAVIIAAIQAVLGKELSQRKLFHSVLRLEQALTTGGGWQDQIGGAVDGVKMISTEPGLVPDARIHYVPSDVLNPQANGGQSLLYYTGITRLAKNILQQVVGRYLNRDRAAMATLRRIHLVAKEVADALAGKDIERFGRLLDVAWQLNKQIDPNSSNGEIESLFERVGPFIYGGKLLGAGGGGFMLMVCKSPKDALSVRQILEAEPPNERARFFDFDISNVGLAVTVC
jgi:fucokinase